MSLVAALLVGSSAFAIDNIKVSGDANVFYSTSDANDKDLFDKAASAADTSLNLNVSADLVKNDLVSVSAKAGYTVLSTLGLEQNFVTSVFGGAHSTTGNSSDRGAHVNNANWVNEAAVSVSLNKASKSTLSLGRMALDTPLAFTETWSIEKNTFEAAVLINQDIPDTTLVAAYVGNGNGTENLGGSTMAQGQVAIAAVVNENGEFDTYGESGAYAVGAINNSFKPLTAQAWYYDVKDVATAYWLQADLDITKLGVDGLIAGVQYSAVTSDADGAKEDNVYAIMAGYALKDIATFKVAYSSVNDDGTIGYAGFNTATAAGTAQSKLYTEAWWAYGQVTQSGTDSITVTAEGSVAEVDLGLYITSVDHDAEDTDLIEYTVTAAKSFGPLDASAAVIYTDNETGDDDTIVQAYLTLNF